MDQEQPLTKYERKQLRRQEKEGRRMQEQKKNQWMKWLSLTLGAGVLLTAVFFVINSRQNPSSKQNPPADLSRAMPDEGSAHVPEGTDVTHQSNPPTSGNHWPIPLFPKVYDVEKPDEAIIHSLEHGRVWISYKPSIPEETKQELTKLLQGRPGVILTPRAANDTDIALAAWGRLDTFDISQDGTIQEDRILNFVNRYLNKGPEYVPAMDGKEY
ncbi:MAG: DUF3105 domain-containing protein [Parcubacteria group bacterium]|nr:DUF3105 domain-containing protein [Parcubacteria group bacterium]